MLISEVIQAVKGYCGGNDYATGKPIDDATTRDQVTYGDVNQECTGIVTCIWATANVIRRAQELGANLIIPHEALFWNHGDHQDVVAENSAYQAKRALLDAWDGAVWRCHDYIHSGVPLEPDGSLTDGIFYGLAWKLGWLDYRTDTGAVALAGRAFDIPEMGGRELAAYVVKRLGLNGTRLIGDPDARVRRVRVPMHVMGHPTGDTAELNTVDAEHVDCLMTMEFIDFTVSEYIRDAAQLGQGKCAIQVGHFNLEEPGMEYMATWLPGVLGEGAPQVTFVPMGDTYQYITA